MINSKQEIVAVVEATTGKDWDCLTIRLPSTVPDTLIAECAIAKARAEMGKVSKWFSFTFRKWWRDEENR